MRKLGIELGAENLVSEAASFGFGARPPIDLPTNPSSVSCMTRTPTRLLACPRSALQANQPFVAYSAIGQGDVEATPLEMAMVASGIADDGVIMTPHVMAKILDPKDNVIDRRTSRQPGSGPRRLRQLRRSRA